MLQFRSVAVKYEFQVLVVTAARQYSNTASLNLFGGFIKTILDQMEEHIAAIRNLQRDFDFHSKRLEKLMLHLTNRHFENNRDGDAETPENCDTAEQENRNT